MTKEIYGVLSFIFWTFTLIPLFKYIFVVLSADDNGEGMNYRLFASPHLTAKVLSEVGPSNI